MSWKKTARNILLSLIISLGLPAVASATCAAGQQSCSSSYAVGEAFFGTGGQLCQPGVSGYSANYCAKSSVGETAVGNTKSTTYQAQAGFNTDRTPYLEFSITSSTSITLGAGGILTPGTASTGTAQFYVKTYLAGNYVVKTYGAAPTYNGHTFTTPGSPASFAAGTEMFGINLVKNQSCSGSPGNGIPALLGNDPQQIPSSTFSFGQAASGYNTACQFKYGNGDTIASYSGSSGETDYTISYLVNAIGSTPAGKYVMNQMIVATSTY